MEYAKLVLQPALIEYEKKVTTRLKGPAHAALPTQVAGAVVILSQVGEGEERRH